VRVIPTRSFDGLIIACRRGRLICVSGEQFGGCHAEQMSEVRLRGLVCVRLY